ncbi:MAG: hypothetical protein Q8L66_16265 [Caulobacter sp.]|nr:hypothetical protein [Caulobacter sp.]
MACNDMRLVSTALILATLMVTATTSSLAVAAPADATLFAYFRTICGPDLDPGRSAARALGQGFVPAKKTAKLGGLDDVQGFEKTVDGREFFVLAASGKGKPRDGMPASSTIACGVGAKGKDEAGLAAGRRWIGVPVSKSVMGVGLYAFRQTPSGRAALSFDDKPAARAAVLAGDLNVLTVSGLGGVSLLLLSRTKAAA